MGNMLMPPVERYMTREPYSVQSTESLARVRTLMCMHVIRHLPVIDNNRLMGIISERDLAAIEAIPGVDLSRIEVSRVMSRPLQTWGDSPLDEVSDLMVSRRADCVVIQGGHGVAGIFTATDAIRALADLLRRATA
jgi:CBS domain-containing protein